MDSRHARWVALALSSAVALPLLWFGARAIRERNQGSVRMNVGTLPARPPPDPDGSSGATPRGRAADPIQPQDWRFYLTPEEAEVFYAISANPRVRYDPWMGVREIPNENERMPWREHPNGEFYFRTNGLGLREDHELDETPRDLRILVAGDSHTCGLCNNSESFPSRLEELLGRMRPGKTVEALNTGLGGYHFLNYLGALYRFHAFKPQVFVCAIFGGNDFTEFYWLYLHFTGRPAPPGTANQYKRLNAALEISADALGQGLASLDTLRNFPDERAAISKAALGMCLEMQRVAARQGTQVVFVHIPSPFELRWPEPASRYVRTRDALELGDADFSILAEVVDRTLDGLRRAGLPVIDMRERFAAEPKPPYWRGDFHLDLRGHELVAEALAPVVDGLIRRE